MGPWEKIFGEKGSLASSSAQTESSQASSAGGGPSSPAPAHPAPSLSSAAQADAQADRRIRVFISSTFRDMHAERDHLVTVVFPELRERVESLGLEFFDVDLRWGVPAKTDDPTKTIDGETANSWEYCKQWIDRVEPFFVCMLAQRYGWVPKPHEIKDDDDRRLWAGRSVTDMEIRHAVFSKRVRRRSSFYLRETLVPEPPRTDPAIYGEFVDTEPESIRNQEQLKAEINACGRPVRSYTPRWTRKSFEDLDAFGRLVLDDLWSGVLRDERYVSKDVWREALGTDPDADSRYSDEATPVPPDLAAKLVALAKPPPRDPLDAEREQMEAFAQTRLRWFQGRTQELRQLTEFIVSTDANAPRLAVVAAAPGQGKSALIAKLAESLSVVKDQRAEVGTSDRGPTPVSGAVETEPDPPMDTPTGIFLITHFVGATERSATAHSLVQRLLDELDRSGIEWPEEEQKKGEEPKRDFKSLCNRLRERLGDYAGDRRIVILLDAINQLTDGHDLHWLPNRLGPGVRVVVSCIEESSPRAPGSVPAANRPETDATKRISPEEVVLHALTTRQPAPLRVPLGPLTEGDVRTIVVKYLKEYCHELDRQHLDALCAIPHARNPLYLLVMLNELRTLGGNDLNVIVPARIASMSRDYPDTVALFRWVLQRLEVFNEKAPDAVKWWCLYLAHGRVGMASHELADLLARKLGADARTTALRIERGLRRYLLRRGGQLDFFHGQLRQAVMEQYGPHTQTAVVNHEVADYFRAMADPGGEMTWLGQEKRPFEELPHHLLGAGRLPELCIILSDLAYLDARVILSGPMSLISDYMSVLAERTISMEAWHAFILVHASTLRMVPSVLPSLAWHADSSEVRQSVEAYSRLGKHRHSWLKLDSLPPVQSPIRKSVDLNLETPSFEVLASCDEIRTSVAAIAPARCIGFYLKQLGHIGVLDFEMGVVSDYDIPYPPLGRPLAMAASADGRWISIVDDKGKGICIEVKWLQGEKLHPMATSQKLFTCLLPEIENPVICFACEHLWWQDDSGYLVFWKPGSPNTGQCIRLKGELRGLCEASDKVIALDVSERDSSVVVIDSDRITRRQLSLPRRIVRLCAYSKSAVILLAFDGGTSILTALSDKLLAGPVMEGAVTNMFPLLAGVYCETLTQCYFWSGDPSAGIEPCQTFKPGSGTLLAFAESHELLFLIKKASALRARRSGIVGDKFAEDFHIQALCPHVPGRGYSVLLESARTLYTAGPKPQQAQPHSSAVAVSARSAVANSGQLVWPETPNHMALWTPPNPPVVTEIKGIGAVLFGSAGKQGEYWFVNDENDIWSMNAQGQGKKLASLGSISRPSPHRLLAGDKWLVWCGTSMGDDKIQSPDHLDTLVFFKVTGEIGNRKLVEAGHHFFEPDNGLWTLTLWDDNSGALACFFQLLGNKRYFVRVGTPADIMRGRERVIELAIPELLLRDLQCGTSFADKRGWLVCTRAGWLTALDSRTFQLIGAYPVGVTGVIAGQAEMSGACLISMDNTEVAACSLIDVTKG